jgi:hypothetical protein
MDARKGVYVAVLNQGEIRAELSQFITSITHQGKYRMMVDYPSHKPIVNNRNRIVQDFLRKVDPHTGRPYDYLFMVDSDIVPPENLMDLLDHDKDIISPVCFALLKVGITPLVMEHGIEPSTGKEGYRVKPFDGTEGMVEVDAVGTGAIIIARRVIEKMVEEDGALFLNQFDKNGIKTIGNDFAFCTRAKQLGFKIFVHLDYIASHWTEVDLKIAYQRIMGPRPEYAKFYEEENIKSND